MGMGVLGPVWSSSWYRIGGVRIQVRVNVRAGIGLTRSRFDTSVAIMLFKPSLAFDDAPIQNFAALLAYPSIRVLSAAMALAS